MAMASKIHFLLLALLVLAVAFPAEVMGGHGRAYGGGSRGYGGIVGGRNLQPEQCPGKCDGRCSDTSYRNACVEFCNKCCVKCSCVPPGTYGSKAYCGTCYSNWKTKEGGPKCP